MSIDESEVCRGAESAREERTIGESTMREILRGAFEASAVRLSEYREGGLNIPRRQRGASLALKKISGHLWETRAKRRLEGYAKAGRRDRGYGLEKRTRRSQHYSPCSSKRERSIVPYSSSPGSVSLRHGVLRNIRHLVVSATNLVRPGEIRRLATVGDVREVEREEYGSGGGWVGQDDRCRNINALPRETSASSRVGGGGSKANRCD